MKRRNLFTSSLLLKLMGLLFTFVLLSAFTAPEKPEDGIYDPNHYLTEKTRNQIIETNQKNSQKDKKLQMGVYIVDSLDGETIESVANETARDWKIGFSGDNNGTLIVIAVKDHKSRIETSNQVATKITDYQTHQILSKARPFFQKEDYNGGVLSIVDNLNDYFYTTLPFTSKDSSESQSYQNKSNNRKSENPRKKNSDDSFVVLGILVYIIIIIIGIIKGGGRGGGSSGGFWFSDNSDSSWSDLGSDSSDDSSSDWDGGGFDGGGSSDDW